MSRGYLVGALVIVAMSSGCRRDDQSDLLPPPGYTDDLSYRFGPGWYELESNAAGESWRWMGGRAELRLKRLGGSPGKLALRGHARKALLAAAPIVHLTLDGQELDRFAPSLDASGNEYVIQKDYSVAGAAPAASEFETLVIESSVIGSAPGDTRQLGIAFTAIEWGRGP